MSFEEGVIRQIVREEVEAGASKRLAKKPRIFTKTMTDADTEYEMGLLPKTKKFTMHLRETGIAFRFAFEKGRVETPKEPYFTVPADTPYWEDQLDTDEIFKIYVACGTAAQTVELIAWK